MGQNIFISYRRAGTEGYAGRIYDRLAERFSSERVFMDVTDIGVGEDFVDAIGQAIGSCRVVIVLIGQHWHTVTDEMGRRRLDDPHDFVHLEVKSALERGILVVPVLVHGAAMPRVSDLPVDISELARRNSIEIRHRHFDADAKFLVAELERHFGESDPRGAELSGEKAPRRILVWSWLLILIFIVILGLGGYFWLRDNSAASIILTQETVDSTLTAIAEVDVTATNTITPHPPTDTATEIPSVTPPPRSVCPRRRQPAPPDSGALGGRPVRAGEPDALRHGGRQLGPAQDVELRAEARGAAQARRAREAGGRCREITPPGEADEPVTATLTG